MAAIVYEHLAHCFHLQGTNVDFYFLFRYEWEKFLEICVFGLAHYLVNVIMFVSSDMGSTSWKAVSTIFVDFDCDGHLQEAL